MYHPVLIILHPSPSLSKPSYVYLTSPSLPPFLPPSLHSSFLQEAGRLLPCGVGEWVHVNCAVWSAEVYEECSGALCAVHTAISRGKMLVRGRGGGREGRREGGRRGGWEGGGQAGRQAGTSQGFFHLLFSSSPHPPSGVTSVVRQVPLWGAAAATVPPTTTSSVPVATAAGSLATRRSTASSTSPWHPLR